MGESVVNIKYEKVFYNVQAKKKAFNYGYNTLYCSFMFSFYRIFII